MTRPHPERILSYLEDILVAAQMLGRYVHSCTREDFCTPEGAPDAVAMVRDAVVRRLEIIGQALHNIQTADPAYVVRQQLDVGGWYGLRSKISHGYESVDYGLLWAVVESELPALVAQVQNCLGSCPQHGTNAPER